MPTYLGRYLQCPGALVPTVSTPYSIAPARPLPPLSLPLSHTFSPSLAGSLPGTQPATHVLEHSSSALSWPHGSVSYHSKPTRMTTHKLEASRWLKRGLNGISVALMDGTMTAPWQYHDET